MDYYAGADWHDPANRVTVSDGFRFRGFMQDPDDEPEDEDEPEPEVRSEADTWL